MTTIGDWLNPSALDESSRLVLQQEGLIFEVTELIAQAMREQGVTKAELAKRLGKSRPFVTQLLDGSANMTLKTIADVFTVLGLELRIASARPAWSKRSIRQSRTEPVSSNRQYRPRKAAKRES